MGQNKLDNQIKEKLNSREIQPSSQAWDRLDAMLTVAEEKKTKRSFGWLYIAASVTILLTVGMYFFTQNGTEISTQNNVVGTEAKKDAIQKEGNNPEVPIDNTIVKNQETQVAVSNPNINQQSINTNQKQNSIINQKTNQNNQSNQNQNNQNQIIKDKEIVYQNSSDVALKDLPKTVEPKEIVFAGSKNSTALTDEQLLASLDNSAKKSNKKASVKVDAKNLLSQVDGELEMTFREKVIDKVSKKYKKIEVALANRNNE
jgi:hypothetical protein